MTVARRLLVLVAFTVLPAVGSFASAPNIYITQSGSASGNCTTNVQTPAFFNNPSNWGGGANQIGPGTAVLLCGTLTFPAGTSGLIAQGSGASGNVITIQFDTGAIVQSPAFAGAWDDANGGIVLNGVSYITVDGEGTGTLQNTLAGSPGITCPGGACTYQQSSYGIKIRAASNITIQNLTITNIYNQCGASSSCGDSGGQDTADIGIDEASTSTASSNILIYNNYLYKSSSGFGGTFTSGNMSGLEIKNNTFNDHNWQMSLQAGGSVTTSGILIHNNDISNFNDWGYPSGTFHQDGIITLQASTSGPTWAPQIYNNYFHGGLGNGPEATAYLYCTAPESTGTFSESCTIYNNVFSFPNGTSNTAIWFGQAGGGSVVTGPHYVYNNTFVGPTCSGAGGYGMVFSPSIGQVYFENNIMYNFGVQITSYASTTSAFAAQIALSNYNVWNTTCSPGWNYNFGGSGGSLSYAQWQALGFDANSSTASPNLSSQYTPGTGSSAIALGTNLTSLGLTNLDTSAPQTFGVAGVCGSGCVQRPATSSVAWGAGAYAYTTSAQNPPPPSGSPNPPTDLSAIVH